VSTTATHLMRSERATLLLLLLPIGLRSCKHCPPCTAVAQVTFHAMPASFFTECVKVYKCMALLTVLLLSSTSYVVTYIFRHGLTRHKTL